MRRGHLVVAATCSLFLCLGSLYGWGNESPYLTSYLRARSGKDIQYADTLFVFGVCSFSVSLGMLLAGVVLDPKPHLVMHITVAGAVLFAVSVAVTIVSTALSHFLLTYGLLRGLAMGFCQIGPMVVAQRWFPRRIGAVSGLIKAFIGAGGVVWNPLVMLLVNPDNEDRDDNGFFPPDSSVVERVPRMLLIMSVVFFCFAALPSFLISQPPSVTPEEESALLDNKSDSINADSENAPSTLATLPESSEGVLDACDDSTLREAVTSTRFWVMAMWLVTITVPGHLVLGTFKDFGSDFSDAALTQLAAATAIANAAGRWSFGALSDHLGVRRTGILLPLLTTAVTAMYCVPGALSVWPLFFALTFLSAFCYGGILGLFPPMVTRAFGIRNFARIYGVIVTAWGLSGIGSDALFLVLESRLSSAHFFLCLTSIAALALLIAFILRPHKPAPTLG